MKKAILVLILLPHLINAQTAGSSGLSFLKNGYGAKNLAMGDLGVTGQVDVSAYLYNPALLSEFTYPQIFAAHNSSILDVKSELLGVSFMMFNIPFAIGLNTTAISDIEVRTKPGEPESKFNAHYFFISLSSGLKIWQNLSAGITLKYLYENLFSDDAAGVGYDLGLHYKGIIENLNLGLSLRNLGSMNELRNESTELPVDFRFGSSYKFRNDGLNSDFVVTAGYQKYTKTDENHFHFGSEILYDKMFAIRIGYITGYESKGLTLGAGILWNDLNFDYAFVPFDFDLGNSHTISLMYSFR